MDISMSLIAEVLSDCSSRGWTVLPVEEEYTHTSLHAAALMRRASAQQHCRHPPSENTFGMQSPRCSTRFACALLFDSLSESTGDLNVYVFRTSCFSDGTGGTLADRGYSS